MHVHHTLQKKRRAFEAIILVEKYEGKIIISIQPALTRRLGMSSERGASNNNLHLKRR